MQEAPALPRPQILFWIIALFLGLTASAYLLSISRGIFVAWDDTYLIFFNPNVKQISLKTLWTVFTSFDPELYIPLTFVSYQIDHVLAGLNPVMFHITNLLLHTANALLAAWFMLLLSGKRSVALAVGLLFALHPLHTEAVMWASARKDLLSTCFLLASLIAYTHYSFSGAKKSYAWSMVFFLLGLLSKVTILLMPLLLLLIDFRNRRSWRGCTIPEKLPFVFLSGIFLVIALFGKRDVVATTTLLQKLLMATKSTTFYLLKLAQPTHLSVMYPYEGIITISSPDFLLPVLIVVLLLLLTAWSMRKTREIAFGIGFFLLLLLPSFSNFAKGGQLYFASDRYAYAASIGVLYLVALTAARVWGTRWRSGFYIGLAGVLAALWLLTFAQAKVWENSVNLFTHTLSLYPRTMAAHLNLSMVYTEMKDFTKAREELELAQAIRPHARIFIAFAALHEREGRHDKAREQYANAIAIDPKDPESYFGLAVLAAKEGKDDEAIALYEKVLTIDLKYVGTYNNLAAIYLKREDREKAEQMYRKAAEIDPFFPDAHFNLGVIAEEDGRIDEAIAAFEKTAALEPHSLDALERLLDLYARKNALQDTVRTARRMLKIDPGNRTAVGLLEALKSRGMLP